MLLTKEQMKHLEPDGDKKFRYINDRSATEDEKQDLRDLDAGFYDVYQEHIITNWEQIK